MQTKTNGNGHGTKTRKPSRRVEDLRPDALALALLKCPENIHTASRHFEASRLELEGHTAAVSLHALTEPRIRVAAKDGGEDTYRAAANDQERRLAIEEALHADQTYVDLRTAHEENARDLELCRNWMRALTLAAKLILKDS